MFGSTVMDSRFTPAAIVEGGAITSSRVGDGGDASTTGVKIAAPAPAASGGADLPLIIAPTSTSTTLGTSTGEITDVGHAAPSLGAVLMSGPRAEG